MLQGTLDSVGLGNLLQMLLREGRPAGLLTISRGPQRCAFQIASAGLRLCREGRDDEIEKDTLEALSDLAHWTRASFEFTNVAPPADASALYIDATRVTQLLIDAVRRGDEMMAAFRRSFPSMDAVPSMTKRWNPRMTLPGPADDIRAVAELIDGKRTLDDVCSHSPRPLPRTMHVLHLLLKGGLVALAPPRPPAEEAPPPPPVGETKSVWKRTIGSSTLVVMADPSMTRAFLQLRGEPLTVDELLRALRESGLRLVADLETRLGGNPTQNLVVAEGVAPTPGRPAELRWKVDWDSDKAQVRFVDDQADFYEIHTILQVKEGDLLGRIVPAEKGADGVDVFGRPIPARPVPGVAFVAGPHVESDGREIRARVFGRLRRDRSRVWIDPLFRVSGDLDFHTGNVRFNGDVLIMGNVMDGFEVDASGTITVMGSVFKSGLKAGKDIVVKEGVNGHEFGRLVAGGSVTARYLNAVSVRAGADVKIYNEILSSTVVCGGRVRIPAGAIVGGNVAGRQGVEAGTAGSPMGVVTQIGAGIDPETEAQMRDLEVRLHHLRERIARIHPIVHPFVERPEDLDRLPEHHRSSIATTLRDHERLVQEMREVEARREALNASDVDEHAVRLRILRRVFGRVSVSIGRAQTSFENEQTGPIVLIVGSDGRLRSP